MTDLHLWGVLRIKMGLTFVGPRRRLMTDQQAGSLPIPRQMDIYKNALLNLNKILKVRKHALCSRNKR